MADPDGLEFFNTGIKANGDVVATDFQVTSVSNGTITAGTTQTQAGATLLTEAITLGVTVANTNDVVKLPPAVRAGRMLMVENGNGAANAMQVFPSSGETINGGAADAADAATVAASKTAIYVSTSTSNWKRVTLE